MKSFEELNLSEPIQKAIKDLGYETPSPIQAQALPILMEGATDFIGLAATGTGKTAAFGIPLLEQIDMTRKTIQVLVMCPTRELALQVSGQLNLLGKYKGVKTVPVYGGTGYAEQIQGFRQGAQIVVGTPGRLIDHIEHGTLKLQDIRVVVLDEADEMISMGFKEDLETILKTIPRESSKIWLFSATMSKEVRKVADTYLRDPKQVQVNRTEMLSSTVEQIYYPTREGDKPEILCKIIDAAQDFYGLIFCQTKSLTTDLTHYLTSRGYKVDCLHGDRDQKERERTMQAFRDKKVRMLVCTDVASRGLDVKDVTHVVNYSIPRELDVYVHRIGRTARSGKSGIAMSLVTPSHRILIGRIEKMTKSQMKEGRVPSRKEIGVLKINKTLAKFMDQAKFARATELLTDEWRTVIEMMNPEEIVSRFLSLTAPEVFADGKDKTPALTSKSVEGSSSLRDSRGDDRGPRKAYGSSRGQSYQDKPFRGGSSRPTRREDGPSSAPSRPRRRDDDEQRSAPSRPSRRDDDAPTSRPMASKPATPWSDKKGPAKSAGSYERPRREEPSPTFERPERNEKSASYERPVRSEKSVSYEKPKRDDFKVEAKSDAKVEKAASTAERPSKPTRPERSTAGSYDVNERSVRREAEERRLEKRAESGEKRSKDYPSQEDLEQRPARPARAFGSKYIPGKSSKGDNVGEQPPRRNKKAKSHDQLSSDDSY